MALYLPAIASELCQDHTAFQLVFPIGVGTEIDMEALEASCFLIQPPRSVVDGTCLVFFLYASSDPYAVELAPGLIEGNPHGDTCHVV